MTFPADLAGRVLRKLHYLAFAAVGRDDLTGMRVRRRRDLVHIGSRYGGWVIPASLLNARSICYCAGCGEDISFDLGLIERFGCPVFGLDPTPRAIAHVAAAAHGNPRYHFTAVGLWDSDRTVKFYAPKNPDFVSHSALNLQKTTTYFEAPVRRLTSLMRDNGHARVDLLKIDIEGAEYDVIRSIIEDQVNLSVLCVEFDEAYSPLDAGFRKRIQDHVILLVQNGYDLVCAQGRGNYTFVRRALQQAEIA